MPEKKNTLWCHAYTDINNEGSTPSTREQAIQLVKRFSILSVKYVHFYFTVLGIKSAINLSKVFFFSGETQTRAFIFHV